MERYWCTLTIISSFQKPEIYKPLKKDAFKQAQDKQKEGKTMQPLKCGRIILILTSLALIFAFGVTTSLAQETVKLKGKVYLFNIKTEVMKVNDTDGHVMLIADLKGVDVSSGMLAHIKQFMDLVKGNGTFLAHAINAFPDGSKWFLRVQGKVATILSPEGKPTITSEGISTLTKGTGKWEGFQGGSTIKGKSIAEGITALDWEGEFTKK
jgi:hypothetical protein